MYITIKTAHEVDANIYSSLLSKEELEKSERYKHRSHYLMSVIAHGMKRELISNILNQDPKTINFSKGTHGKPYCTSDPSIKFNLSHSENFVGIAIDLHNEIGIDIEFFKFINFQSISAAALTAQEKEIYENIGCDRDYLLKKWVTKESLTKANGTGLQTDFRTIYIKEEKNESARSSAKIDSKYYFSKLFTFKHGYFSVSSKSQIKDVSISYL